MKEKDVYILFFDERAMGTITLSYGPPSHYKWYSFWKEPDAPTIYVSKLAVLPHYHGKGFGSTLLKFAKMKQDKKESITYD